jgi:hypothetical protein
MLIHPTVDRLRALGLAAMADTFVELQNNPEAAEMPHADWLGLLVDREVTARDNRRLTRRLTSAKLRQAATIENVDYRQVLACLRARQKGLPQRLFRPLQANIPPVRRSRPGARRRPSGAPDRGPRTRQSPHPRRLGTRTAHCRPAPRSARDRR